MNQVRTALDPFPAVFAIFDAMARHRGDASVPAVLGTADPGGEVATRVVLLKRWDRRGVVFFTNSDSRKGGQLRRNPRASFTVVTPDWERQVHLEGPVDRIPDAETDAYWVQRPQESRVGAWASRQSHPLPHPGALEEAVAYWRSRFEAGGEVPRPPYWNGYRMQVTRVELWRARPFRLHERVVYRKTARGWETVALFP